jgi:pilus assembly protein Flp/PilA
MNFKKIIADFVKDEEGLTIVEYAIAGALVSAAVAGAFTALGTAIDNNITTLTGHVTP